MQLLKNIKVFQIYQTAQQKYQNLFENKFQPEFLSFQQCINLNAYHQRKLSSKKKRKKKHQTKLPQSASQHDRKKTTRRLKRVDGWIQFRALVSALKKKEGRKKDDRRTIFGFRLSFGTKCKFCPFF